MKTISLIFALLVSSISHATDWRNGLGEYNDGDGRRAILKADGNSGFIIYASGSGWGEYRQTITESRFTCNGVRCTSILLYTKISITFLDNDTIVLDYYSKLEPDTTVVLKKLNSSKTPPSTDWSFREYADSNQVRYIASQIDDNSGATLVASCNAKSEQINWAIRLTEKSHLAAQGAVLYAKSTLKVNDKVDSGPMLMSAWSVADNRYITPSQILPISITDLKKGSQVSMTLVAVKPDGKEVKLETMNFSLKGSTAALNMLQESCSPNSNSDLPIPLP